MSDACGIPRYKERTLWVHYILKDDYMNLSQSPVLFGIQCLVMTAERSGKQIKQLSFTSSAWENMMSLSTTHDFQDGFDKTCFGYPVNITEDIQDGVFQIDYFPKKVIN